MHIQDISSLKENLSQWKKKQYTQAYNEQSN